MVSGQRQSTQRFRGLSQCHLLSSYPLDSQRNALNLPSARGCHDLLVLRNRAELSFHNQSLFPRFGVCFCHLPTTRVVNDVANFDESFKFMFSSPLHQLYIMWVLLASFPSLQRTSTRCSHEFSDLAANNSGCHSLLSSLSAHAQQLFLALFFKVARSVPPAWET